MNEQGPSLVKFKSPKIKDPKSLAGTQNGTGIQNTRNQWRLYFNKSLFCSF